MKVRTAKRRVVGIDLSLTGPGLCVLSGAPKLTMKTGLTAEMTLIRLGEKLRGPERLSLLTRSIFSWLYARQPPKPGDLYVMEGYAYAAQQAHSIGEIGGCVKSVIWKLGGNLLVVAPMSLKKYVMGRGQGDKNVMMKSVYKRWGFDSDDDNECDAFACAHLGLVAQLPAGDRVALETETLSKCDWWPGRDQVWGTEFPKREKKKRKKS